MSTPVTSVSPVVAPRPAPVSSVSSSVSSAIARQVPAGFKGETTAKLDTSYLHAMIYGETDRRKTTTAAQFRGPDHTFILLTRSPEQLIPIRSGNYHYARVENVQQLRWALQNPEAAADAAGFPDWKSDPERTLVVDDISEAVSMIVDDNSLTDQGKERDGRQVYRDVNDDIRLLLKSLKSRRLHLVLIALARVSLNEITENETVTPELPSGASKLIRAEMEFCFYMMPGGKMLTDEKQFSYKTVDDRGKEIMRLRNIFAKSKFPVGVKSPLAQEEATDLAAVWKKITEAR